MANLQKKSFWQQYGSLILILGGIIIGALIGAFAPAVGTTIKPIGDIFLNLLFTLVVPLVFVSIASAVGSMANMKRLGKVLGSTIGTFIFTGLIAAACVLVWVNLFSPSAGTSIQLMGKEGNYAILRMPSSEMRRVLITCRATIGEVGNAEHSNIKIGKAGRKRWMGVRPSVRGTVMNPVDHPHGGGEGKNKSAGRHPVTPWGVPTKGHRTRNKKKASSRLIIRRRKK